VTSPTHIFFSEFCLAVASVSGSPDLNSHTAIVAAAGSLLPDIDVSSSWTGRLLPFISKPIEHKFGHRTITHSFVIIIFFIMSSFILSLFTIHSSLFTALTIGYSSHIIIDCTTVQGVKILYPFSMRNAVFPLDTLSPYDYRIKVGTSGDIILGFIFLFLTLPVAYLSLNSYQKTVREVQRDIDSAVRQYNELTKDFIVFARIQQGTNTATHQQVKGDFMIIAAEKPDLLIIRTPQGPLSVGKNQFLNDIFTDDILAVPRFKARTMIQSIDVQNQSLATIRYPYQTADSLIFFSGDIEFYKPVTLRDTVDLPLFSAKFKSIVQTNQRLKLNLEPYDLLKSMNITDDIIKTARLTIKAITLLEHSQSQDTMPILVNPSSKFQLVEIKQSENLRLLIDTGSTITVGQAIGFIQTNDIQRLKLEMEQFNSGLKLLESQEKKEENTFAADTALVNDEMSDLETQKHLQEDLVSRQLAGKALLNELTTKLKELQTKKAKLSITHSQAMERINSSKQKALNSIAQINLKILDLEQKHTITATNQGTVKEIRSFTNGTKKQFLIVCQP
jgi:inner membrane protein